VTRALSRWFVLLALAGCAAAPRGGSLYEQLGGQPGITAIVEGLLFKVVENPRIAHHFAETDIIQLRDRLVEQFCVEADGPCTYSGRSMAESHAGRHITEAEFNALVEDLIDVMEEQGVPVAAQNRLLRKLAPMRADIIRR
jgi:hemoglobin